VPTSLPVVLILIKGLGIGGAERLVAAGAKWWDTSRFDYHVAYVLPWKDNLVPGLAELGVDVHCIGSRKGMDMATLGRFRRLVHDLDVSLVHAHLPTTGIMARCLAGVPTVYTEHNLADSYRWPTRFMNRATYGRNAAVTAVSSAVVESLAGYPGPAPILVENGVDPDLIDERARDIRAELELPADARLVVHVGNIRPHKGHDTLIAAAEILARKRDDVMVVSIGGEKHPGDLDRLNEKVRSLGVGDAIRFLGRRTDAAELIAAADVFVNPSDVEGLPVAILEAMVLGKPVVATAVGGVPSVVRDGVSGRLVDPSDAHALAAAVLEVLESADRGKSLGDAARRMVIEHHGIGPMIRRFEEIYASVLADGR
jgi:glycosyltransferase involved in cell wall biosynthesis